MEIIECGKVYNVDKQHYNVNLLKCFTERIFGLWKECENSPPGHDQAQRKTRVYKLN